MITEFYFEPALNLSERIAVSLDGGGYVHRNSPYKARDPYPEFDSISGSRFPGWMIWAAERFKPMDVSSNCGGYVPGMSYKKLVPNCFRDRPHHGLDVSATPTDRAKGTDGLVAPFDATVIKAGFKTGYGNRVEILLDATQIILTYSHMKSTLVKSGDKVKAGTLLGYEDNSGCPDCGDHLHLEVADGKQLKYTIGEWLPHARTLHEKGLLWNPWYVIDFKQYSNV